jgi:hypothetical protein
MEARMLEERLSRFFTALILGGSVFFAGPALAADPTLDECASANEDATALQKRGALLSTREKLTLCTNAVCPRLVRDDCAVRLTALEASIPTIVLGAREGANDVTAVTVTMDGKPLTSTLDGKPIELDPGPHAFTFAYGAYGAQTQELVIREGEKARMLTVTFGETPKPVVMSPFLAVPPREEEKKSSFTPWIIGGSVVIVATLIVVGVVALAGSSGETTRREAPPGSIGGINLASFR